MKKKLMSLVLALTVVFTSSALASAARRDYVAEFVNLQGQTPFNEVKASAKTRQAYYQQLLQFKAELDKALKDNKKARIISSENSYNLAKEYPNSDQKLEEKIASINAEIAKIDEKYKISKDAHGEDLAKYFLKADLAKKDELVKQIETEKSNALKADRNKAEQLKVAQQYRNDAEAEIAAIEKALEKVRTEIRAVRALGTTPVESGKEAEPKKPAESGKEAEPKKTAESTKENPLSKLNGDKLNLHPLNDKVVKEIAELAKAKEVKEVKPADQGKATNPETGDYGVAAAMTTLVAAGAALVASKKRK